MRFWCHTSQCAPGFSNPNQKAHELFHFYIAGINKKDNNQLKKQLIIRLKNFLLQTWLKNAINEQVLVKKIRFLRIIVLEAWWQMIFSIDSDLFYVYLQYKTEKVHGLGWKKQEHTGNYNKTTYLCFRNFEAN